MNAPLLTFPACETIAIDRLQRFRGELADLAFSLEMRGRIDTADVVNAIAARLTEIENELTSAGRTNHA